MTLIEEKKLNPGKGRRFGADPGKQLGEHPQKGGMIVAKNGRYGPYVSHNGVNANLPNDKTPETITLDEAVALIDARAESGGGSSARRKRPARGAPAKKAAAPRQRSQAEEARRGERRQGAEEVEEGRRGRRSKPRLSAHARPRQVTAQSMGWPRQARHDADGMLATARWQIAAQTLNFNHQTAPSSAENSLVKHHSKQAPFPSKEEILAFIGDKPGKIGTREIARAFNLKNDRRVELKRMLRELADEGRVESQAQEAAPPRRPALGHARRHHRPRQRRRADRDADRMGRGRPRRGADDPHRHAAQGAARRSRRRRRPRAAARRGDRRGRRVRYTGRVIKIIDKAKVRALGIFRALPGGGGRLVPIDKKQLGKELAIPPGATKDAQDGDLVAVERRSRKAGSGCRPRASRNGSARSRASARSA